jgi:molybdate transport system ATP-binding protein
MRVIDAHHAQALDWHMTLTCMEREIPVNATAVGIRAHSFAISEKTERSSIADINYFPIKAYQILEDVFEWNVSFKPNEESTWIQWKIAKSDWNVNEKRMPEFLSVNADELLFF